MMFITSTDKELIVSKLDRLSIGMKSNDLISKIFAELPFSSSVFEMNLTDSDNLDVSILLLRKNKDIQDFLNKENIDYYNSFAEWKNIINLLKGILNSPEYNLIDEIWMEFDVKNSSQNKVLIPGIFIQMMPFSNNIYLTSKLILLLVGRDIYESRKKYLGEILQTTGLGVLIHIGFFYSRESIKIRFLYMMNKLAIRDFLEKFHVNDNMNEILSLIQSIINDKVVIHIDILNNTCEFQGIELYATDYSNWTPIFSILISKGWCSNFCGKQSLKWPDGNNIGTNYRNGINHIKLINSGEKKAKVYFFSDFE